MHNIFGVLVPATFDPIILFLLFFVYIVTFTSSNKDVEILSNNSLNCPILLSKSLYVCVAEGRGEFSVNDHNT